MGRTPRSNTSSPRGVVDADAEADAALETSSLDSDSGEPDKLAGHVLIVEDDHLTALVLSEYLAAHGYRTTVARNGPDGVASFIADPPDLALVDVLLPRKNGFETCFEMKHSAHGRETPVVLMSAVYRHSEQADDYVRGLMAAELLHKPFDLDLLLSRVRALVGER